MISQPIVGKGTEVCDVLVSSGKYKHFRIVDMQGQTGCGDGVLRSPEKSDPTINPCRLEAVADP